MEVATASGKIGGRFALAAEGKFMKNRPALPLDFLCDLRALCGEIF
jgi:hypothetical protein